jgi:hypothetical protein
MTPEPLARSREREQAEIEAVRSALGITADEAE